MFDGRQTTERAGRKLAVCSRELLEVALMTRATDVSLLPFPRDDETFVRRAERLLDTLDGGAMASPGRLQALLRHYYPAAIVRPRDGLGAVDGSTRAWYVYRDGGLTPQAVSDEAADDTHASWGRGRAAAP